MQILKLSESLGKLFFITYIPDPAVFSCETEKPPKSQIKFHLVFYQHCANIPVSNPRVQRWPEVMHTADEIRNDVFPDT